jgi:beta-galactosidase
VTPVFVYTSGDEAELFLNGKSLGRKRKGKFEYRLRWNDVVYQPGKLKVVAYKNGKVWAENVVQTTKKASKIELIADRSSINADGQDLSFITVKISDNNGLTVPRTHNSVTYSIEGPGEIIAIGNGDPTNHESFQAKQRKVFNGLALVVVRSEKGETGKIVLKAESEGLKSSSIEINTK